MDGSMGSPPKMEPLPMTENADGSMVVDLSNLENPDVTISASVDCDARRSWLERLDSLERLFQRETIASSSNPFNLHWSQTPYSPLAVPPPCEIADEQRSESQRPSLAFPSDPAGMGDDKEAAVFQSFCASYKSDGLSSKRIRGPDCTDEEKAWVLPAWYRDSWENTEKMRLFFAPSVAICENLLAPVIDMEIFRRDPIKLVNPDTVSAFVNRVARQKIDYRRKNKELRIKLPMEYINFMGPLIEMGFDKIAKVAPTYIVLREDKSRVEEDDSQKKSNLTSANELHEGTSDDTLMQRGTIASSSNPVNPICNQTPGGAPLGAAPPPWETACELVQHSSDQPSFPSGPGSTGNAGNEASGLQGFAAGPEIQVVTRRRPHSANKSKPPSKRTRGRVFKDEEKGSLLQFKVEYLEDPANEGKRHAWLLPVTEKMEDNGHVRDPESWRGLWETLMKSCKALQSKFPRGTGYWDLTMDQKIAIKKDDCHFPLTFEPEWFAAMENIWKMKPRRASQEQTRWDGQEGAFTQSLVSTMTGSAANFAVADCLEETSDESDSESETMDIPTDEEVSSGESGGSVESHTEIASADSHGPRIEPSRKRSAASAFDEDSLFAKIRPFVNQQIEEAVLPLINALRSREEDEHKHRQKMLALEREKLALMRQKLESARRSNAVPARVAK